MFNWTDPFGKQNSLNGKQNLNMLTFSRDQSSLISMSLDAQPDYTVVNSHLMSVFDKAPHRLEAGLLGSQTGAVFHKPLDELRNLIILIDLTTRVVQTHYPKTCYLSQQNDTTSSLYMAPPELASLDFPAGRGVTSIGPSETYSISQTLRTKTSGVESRGIAVVNKGRRERGRDSQRSVCEIEAKREVLRERNRIAANKCRQQKRARINELQVKEKDLISRKHYLNMVVEILRNELVVLRSKCLEHAGCGCESIREYLDDTVAGLSPTAFSACLYQDLDEDVNHEQSQMAPQQQSTQLFR